MSVCNLSVATNERVKQGEEWVDHTEWHRVVVFGKQAESCAKYLAKGSKVAVRGKVRSRKWTDAQNIERTSTEILADNVEFMTKLPSTKSTTYDNPTGSYNDEIPF
jgi:single-strand DNA-binding protein